MHFFTSKRLITSWAVFLILLLFSESCTILTDHTTPPPVTTVGGFHLSKTNAFPLEVLTVTLDEPSDKTMLDAKLGTTPVVLQQIDPKTYGFQVPQSVTPGSYDVSLQTSSKTASLTIKESPVIADPVAYVQDNLKQTSLQSDRIKSVVDSLIKQNLITAEDAKNDLNALQKNSDNAKAQFDALSETDKILCAQYFAANRSALDSLNQLLANYRATVPLVGGRKMAESCPQYPTDEYITCLIIKQKKVILFASYCIAVFAVSIRLPNKLVAAVAAALSGVGLAISIFEVKNNNEIGLNVLSQETEDEPQLSPTTPSSTNSYISGVSQAFRYLFKRRNIQPEDKNSKNQDLKDLVNSVDELNKQIDNNFGDLAPELTTNYPPPRSEFKPAEDASKLSVTVLNNPKVTGTISNFKQGLFDLTFATAEKVDQLFDYVIRYQYGNTPVQKTVTNNKLTVPASPVDLTDCKIVTADGAPITKIGEVDKEYLFGLAGTCKFPAKTLFSWNFGDGTPDQVDVDNNTYRHTYKTAGQYTIKLRVLLNSQLDYLNFSTTVQIGPAASDYYYSVQFNGNTYTFPSVYAQYIGGRFDIVGDAGKLQTAIFFYPASLAVRGPSLNKFVYHCTTTSDQPDKYVLGAHLYDFNTQRAIETTYSRGAVYGCDASQPDDNTTPGQLIITQNDGSVVEGTFEYTDYISKQPVQGKFRVPIR